jgi:RHS repeat-associated protein
MGCLKLHIIEEEFLQECSSSIPLKHNIAFDKNDSKHCISDDIGCGECYRYSFQGQEKDDEISGTGNSYTAEFWQYDPRLGRRWNLDPVVKEWESPYSCFSDNPVLFIDPKGDDKIVYNEDGTINKKKSKKRSKVHEFIFGSKAIIIDTEGNKLAKYKFNDWRDGQIEKMGVSFDNKLTEVDQQSINASVQNQISECSSFETKHGNLEDIPEKFINQMLWIRNNSDGGNAFDYTTKVSPIQSETGLYIIDGRIYNKMDAGNYFWGKTMRTLKTEHSVTINYIIVKVGTEINGFWNGKIQNSKSTRSGKRIEDTFNLARITWYGDSNADQKAIRKGYYNKK